MSPEEWLASRSKGASSATPMSPEEFMASRKAPVETPASTVKSPSVGTTDVATTGGGAAMVYPTSRRRDIPVEEQTFGYDPNRVGSVPLSEYKSNIGKNAAIGGAIGTGIGAVTGPGALVTGAGGTVMGALSGLAESVAKDLGYGGGVQTLAGMAAGGTAPVKNTVDYLAKSKLAQTVFSKAEDLALSMIPKYGTVRKIGQIFTPEAKIAGKDAEKALNVEAKTAGVGNLANQKQAALEIEKEFGPGLTGNTVYENAKSAYDNAGASFLSSPQYKAIIDKLPAETKAAQEAKIAGLFKDEAGNVAAGHDVINNLKGEKFSQLSSDQRTQLRTAFNDFLESKGVGRLEENARKISEKEFVAKAKDELPLYFESGNAKNIKKQIYNYAKDEVGTEAFKQEFAHYLSGRPVSEAKKLWGQISSDVNKAVIKDPVEFQRITDVINNAKTKKDLDKVGEMIIKATYGAYELKKEKR